MVEKAAAEAARNSRLPAIQPAIPRVSRRPLNGSFTIGSDYGRRFGGPSIGCGPSQAGRILAPVSFRWEVVSVDPQMVFPRCQKCKIGDLIPLSDFGSQGAAIHYKAWVCTNPDCGFNLKIRNGDIYVNETLSMGNHSARIR